MNKLFFTLLALSLTQIVFAQQDTIAKTDTVWRTGGLIALNFSQVTLSHWAAGGQNSLAANGRINYFANYKRGNKSWDNSIDLAYGVIKQGEGALIKSDDKIDVSSKYGIQASKHWYYSALFNFRSQFRDGYNYPNDSTVISKFLAPAYVTLALGMDYKPNDHFSLFLSPAAMRFVIVTDQTLSDAGAFGVDSGKMVLTEAGANLKASYKADIASNINLATTLDLYSNYIKNPQNIEVNWQVLLLFKITKLLTASVATQLLYDDKTKLVFYKSDGVTVDHIGPGVQFQEVLGIGLAYKFSGVTVK